MGTHETLRDAYLDFLDRLLEQMAAIVSSNCPLTVMQRLCRWLLLLDEEAGRTEIPITQELLATLVGARRAGINSATSKLQAQGLIRHRRGYVEVPDRETLACLAGPRD